jgi:phosphoribosyl-AMP cyclohydrolase
MNIPELKYDANGLIPAIIQDAENSEVLMMAYMNKTSLEKTVETGYTYFWSRSRQKYWKKGETSGHIQEVKAILYDCDKDTVLIKVIQHGPGACHTGHRSCFFTDITEKEIAQKVFSESDVYGKK